MKKVILISLLIVIFSYGAWAQLISITGSWSEIINEFDLQGPPGSNLNLEKESAVNAVVMGITNGPNKWRVDVRKVDSNWNSNLLLYLKRTSDGIGGPGSKVYGGTSYMEISDVDQSFVTGARDRTNIDIQFKVSGLSINIPVGTYITTVYYTVVEY